MYFNIHDYPRGQCDETKVILASTILRIIITKIAKKERMTKRCIVARLLHYGSYIVLVLQRYE